MVNQVLADLIEALKILPPGNESDKASLPMDTSTTEENKENHPDVITVEPQPSASINDPANETRTMEVEDVNSNDSQPSVEMASENDVSEKE